MKKKRSEAERKQVMSGERVLQSIDEADIKKLEKRYGKIKVREAIKDLKSRGEINLKGIEPSKILEKNCRERKRDVGKMNLESGHKTIKKLEREYGKMNVAKIIADFAEEGKSEMEKEELMELIKKRCRSNKEKQVEKN